MPSSYVRYATASEVVRDGLRALEEREKLRAAQLDVSRAEIERGAESGAGIPAKTVFAAVRKRIKGSSRSKPA